MLLNSLRLLLRNALRNFSIDSVQTRELVGDLPNFHLLKPLNGHVYLLKEPQSQTPDLREY